MTHPDANGRHLWPVNGPDPGVHELDPEPFPDPVHDPYESTPPTTTRRVRLTPAAGIRLRPTFWLWDGRMPHGAITIGPGREGIGKSLFCAWLAARVTLGELPGEHYGQPKSVIYAATEDSWERTLAGRLVVAGADMNRVFRVEVEHIGGMTLPLSLPKDCDAMASEITAHDVALLIVDPLISVLDEKINPHADRDLRTGLEPLAKLADQTGCTIFGLAHFNKASGTDVLSRIMGGRAFSAVARAVIAFARNTRDGDGSCVISQVKNNLGKLDVPSLRYVVESVELDTAEGPAQWGQMVITGETNVHVNDLLDDAPPSREETDRRKERELARAWLLEFLAGRDEPTWANDLYAAGAEVGNWSEDQLKNAKKNTPITVKKVGKRWYWQLPADDDAADSEEEGKSARAQERTEADPPS
ncbi:AAA family ATPase [Amycolatopsis sp. cmx-11-32]|uniref:AAA family ATPase n=1 Tax=Amycolatopsis sp. cmx-11-32 TaxID=2785796 RepID=UPI0039E54F50